MNLVPIVYGPHRDDVKAIAPPNSYIHAEDFDSADQLVKYVDFLDKNDSAYLQYHSWRALYPAGNHKLTDTFQHLGEERQINK